MKAQRADGYIHTPVIIEEKNKGIDTHSDKQQQTVIGTKVGGEDEKGAFANRLNFETYNLGHLMMAGIIHRRATGKTTLFDAAVKATDFLCHFYETACGTGKKCHLSLPLYGRGGNVPCYRESPLSGTFQESD